jgi:RNA polymerase sigma-70 factor (ECF subfamily)
MGTPSRAAVQVAPLPVPDEEVVRRVRGGEVALFEVLMRRHNPRVYRAVRSILRDEAAVEDAMQQAWLRAYEGLDGFAGASAFSTWLIRIAVNEALGRLRRDGRMALVEELPERLEALMEPKVRDPEDGAAASEAVRLVEAAVDRLPIAYRCVFVMRDVDGLSTAEAAAALGISEEAVKVRLHRARLALRDALFAEVGTSARSAFPFLAPRCNRVVEAVLARIGGRGVA